MFCKNCGNQMSEQEQFCTNCGATREPSASTVQTGSGSKLYDWLIIAAVALMALGTLLPCFELSFWGESATFNYLLNEGELGDGIFVIIAAIAAFVLYYLNKDKFMCIPCAISVLVLIVLTSNVNDASGMIDFAIGYYVMWIATIAAIVLPFTPLAKTRSIFFRKK